MMRRSALAVLGILIAAACSKDSAKTADTMAVAADTALTPVASSVPPPSAESISGMMNPNTVSDIELAAAGVPTDVAAKIVAGRPYANMVAVDKILAASMSEKQRDSVYARMWIAVDLNTATDAEILLIPGVGSRMLREFKEYRPWTSAEQFQREIGKYVDKAEVARLQKYTTMK